MRVAADLRAALLAQHPVEQPVLERQGEPDAPLPQVDALVFEALGVGRIGKRPGKGGVIAHARDLRRMTWHDFYWIQTAF